MRNSFQKRLAVKVVIPFSVINARMIAAPGLAILLTAGGQVENRRAEGRGKTEQRNCEAIASFSAKHLHGTSENGVSRWDGVYGLLDSGFSRCFRYALTRGMRNSKKPMQTEII